MSDTDSSFLSRWSRRKAAVREGKAVPEEPLAQAAPPQPPAPAPAQDVPATTEPLPTLADVAQLRPGENIARFLAQGVDESVKRAALKTLFADPHFNVMDGLDTYIDDYGKPDPIPLGILRKLRQSEALGLFPPAEEEDAGQQQALQQEPRQDPQAGEAPAPAPASVENVVESTAANLTEHPATNKHA